MHPALAPEKLRYLVTTLVSTQTALTTGGRAGASALTEAQLGHFTEPDLLTLLRALMNTWQPGELPADFWQIQDAALQALTARKGVVGLESLPASSHDQRLRLWRGDITRLQVGAIVNAANSALLGCFAPGHHCIDNAIHSAAGLQLRLACADYMRQQAPGYAEPTGSAVITPAYNLPAQAVIHTVGPIVGHYSPTAAQQEELASSYRSCLALARNSGLSSIALCCVSTGVFGYPQEQAAQVAVEEAQRFLNQLPAHENFTIIFNVFSERDHDIYSTLLNPTDSEPKPGPQGR